MDTKSEKKIRGLTRTQVELLASLYAGRAELLAKKRAADCLAKWKHRKIYVNN